MESSAIKPLRFMALIASLWIIACLGGVPSINAAEALNHLSNPPQPKGWRVTRLGNGALGATFIGDSAKPTAGSAGGSSSSGGGTGVGPGGQINCTPTPTSGFPTPTPAPPKTISGYVTYNCAGLGGVTLSGFPGGSIATNSSGYYTATVDYGWSGTVTPIKAGYTFSPSSRSYTNVTSNQSSQNYTASIATYTISGQVTCGGAGVSGVTMSGLPGSPQTDGSGNYSATVNYGWSATVTPTKTGYTFSPSSRSYSNVSGNQANQNYTASIITYTISGQVKNSAGTGISGVTLSGLPGSPATDASGYYSATVNYGWSGTATPTKSGYTFSPVSKSYSNVTANQTQNYTASIVVTYTISGKVTCGGVGVSGVMLNGLPGSPVTDASGNYSATVNSGWNGTATPAKAGYTFSPVSMPYSNVTANKTNQNYTATINTYTISGRVTYNGSGLYGVTLSGLPGSPVTNSSGYYSATVSYGWSGTATPTKSRYKFTPADRSYSNVTANQTSQNYTASKTCHISGTITYWGWGMSGVTVCGLPGSPVTDINGNYCAEVDSGWNGTATPTKSGYSFTAQCRSYSNVGDDHTSEHYTGQH